MNNIIRIARRELLLQNRIYNLNKYLFIFFIFASLSITLINSHQDIQKFGTIFSIISIPLAFISMPGNILKPEIEDGSLELVLLLATPHQIIVGKFLAIYLASILSFVATLPVIYFVFNISSDVIFIIISCGILILLQSAALTILISAVQGYFRSNTNFLAILIMPLIIPTIILSGILLQDGAELGLIWIIAGISLILVPIGLYLSGYLIENIYNI